MESAVQEFIGTVVNGVVVLPSGSQIPEGALARVVTVVEPVEQTRPARRPGSAKGKFVIPADDDEHLNDFGEYLRLRRGKRNGIGLEVKR
jgi:hypothetical protein